MMEPQRGLRTRCRLPQTPDSKCDLQPPLSMTLQSGVRCGMLDFEMRRNVDMRRLFRSCQRHGWAVVMLVLLTAACARLPLALPPPDPIVEHGVTVRGVVAQLLLEPGRQGQPWRGLVLQGGPAAGLGPEYATGGIFIGMHTNPWLPSAQGPVWPAVGDELVIRGRPHVLSGRPALIEPTLILRLGQGIPPETVVPVLDVNPPADARDADAYWAAHHGRRGRVPAGALVQGYHLNDYGPLISAVTVIRDDLPWLADREGYARRVFRDAHPLDDQPGPQAVNGNGFRILLGDGGLKFQADDPDATLPPVRTFDRLMAPLEGVLLRSGARTWLHVDAPPVFAGGLEPDLNQPPPYAATPAHLRVAVYNIENLYDHRDDPFDPRDDVERDARGNPLPEGRRQNYVPATEAAYRGRLQGLATQIVRDLESPDVILLQEVEDQDIGTMTPEGLRVGTVDNRDGRPDVLQELAAEILRRGGPAYEAVADRAAADDRGIICAYLYRPDRLRPVTPEADHPVLSGEPRIGFDGAVLGYRYAPSNPRAINAWTTALGLVAPRAPQVFALEAQPGSGLVVPGSGRLYLINNHFKSRPQDFVAERRAQAALSAALAEALLRRDPGCAVIVGGDLNTFPRPDEPTPESPTDQLGALYEAGLVNLHDRQLADYPEGAYTYIFEGQAQTLDHVMVSPALDAALADVRVLHLNADYPPDPLRPDRRCSDHDPVVATFLAPVAVPE